MTPRKILSNWLFSALAGTFVEGVTLYINRGQASDALLNVEGAEVTEEKLVTGYSITNGRVYPIATRQEVKAPYVVYDSIRTTYSSTKDGTFPSSITARVMCVDKDYEAVGALADTVEARLDGAGVDSLGVIEMTSRSSDYDASTDEFVEELIIKIDL